MSGLPIDPLPREDPLDPERILQALPEQERETFLRQYQRAVGDARHPAGWKDLRRFLRLWAMRAVAVGHPGYYEARDTARDGTGDGYGAGTPLKLGPRSFRVPYRSAASDSSGSNVTRGGQLGTAG